MTHCLNIIVVNILIVASNSGYRPSYFVIVNVALNFAVNILIVTTIPTLKYGIVSISFTLRQCSSLSTLTSLPMSKYQVKVNNVNINSVSVSMFQFF